MKRISVSTAIAAVMFALVLTACAPASAAPAKKFTSAQQLWDGVKTNWNKNINNYTTKIFSWAYRTPTYIKNNPDQFKKDETPEPDWLYRMYYIRYKKPRKIMLRYDLSMREHTERGSIIDKGIAYMLRYAPGTTLNFGYKDEEKVYVVFPKVSNKKFMEMPIGVQWRALMKVLLIASHREVYWKTLEDMTDVRGSKLTDVIVLETMARFDPSFAVKDGSVVTSLEPAPRLTRDDYELDESTGWLKLKKSAASKPKDILKIVFIDKNSKRNKGVTKREAFVDPNLMMFTGTHEFEGDKLVGVFQFSEFKPNVDLPDSLWSDFFKGRKLSDKK